MKGLCRGHPGFFSFLGLIVVIAMVSICFVATATATTATKMIDGQEMMVLSANVNSDAISDNIAVMTQAEDTAFIPESACQPPTILADTTAFTGEEITKDNSVETTATMCLSTDNPARSNEVFIRDASVVLRK